jgi:murein peptide amidase A
MTRVALVALAVLVLAGPGAGAAAPNRVLLGRSVEGRPIEAVELGNPDAARKVLVVGCIHGNECAGIAIARKLEGMSPPKGVDLWVVESLNPDGYAAGTRDNARGVDLNRNFPWGWRDREGPFDSGPQPLSEPESRIAYRLILGLRPAVSIWFHQHLSVVDGSGGNAALERRFARLVGLSFVTLPRYPGSVTTWENHVLPGKTAFVVELPAGALTSAQAARYTAAVLAVSRPLAAA